MNESKTLLAFDRGILGPVTVQWTVTAPLGSREGSPSRRRGYKGEDDALPFVKKIFHVIRNA